MTSPLVTVLAGHRPDLALSKHRVYCSCGEWAAQVSTVEQADRSHAHHVDDEVAAAGLAVITLPPVTGRDHLPYRNDSALELRELGAKLIALSLARDAAPPGE